MRMELVCPKSKTTLEISGDMLVSREGNKYPIKNGVPRFVEEDNYSNSFGEQWNMFSETQLDSYSGKKITENRLTKCFGLDLWGKLENKSVLECGCGAGRFTEILLKKKANVCSVDFSCAVDANVKNFEITDKHKVFQADILGLPFKEESFDIVFCLGVIQHTPDPEKTIAALYRQVKPGGFLIIDHYKYLLSWYLHPAPIIRFFLKRYSRKSPKNCIKLVQIMVNTLFPIHWKLWNIHPRLNWLLNRISPVITYFATFPELNEEQHKEWSFLDTHDSLTDWYKHRTTVKQVTETLEGLGVENIECRYGGNGVEARGQRPQRELEENKIVLEQGEQDNIWLHFQNCGTNAFHLSKPRLRFLAEQCISGTRVLNIGVGSGYLEKLLAERGVEVYSLDPCGESIERLRNELSMGDRAKQGYSSNIPFEKGCFDKVIMTEVMEHLSVDTLSVTLEEVGRVLKLGGEFTGTVPYREDLRVSEVFCPSCKLEFHRWGHIQSFDAESLRDLLKHHGFYIKRLYARSFPDFRRRGLKPFIRAVSRYVLGRMGEQLVSPNLYFIAKVGGDKAMNSRKYNIYI